MNHMASRLLILRGLAGGISQRELAELAGISPAYPGFLERSPETPTIGAEIALRIATTLGCSIEYLVRGVGQPPTEEAARDAVATARERLAAEPQKAAGS
jgi:transcriptional regulator with XRE-family HTH domain